MTWKNTIRQCSASISGTWVAQRPGACPTVKMHSKATPQQGQSLVTAVTAWSGPWWQKCASSFM